MNNNIIEKFQKGYNYATAAASKVRGTSALKDNPSEEELLYNSINIAHYELEQAVSTFNQLTDEKAVDYASYNLLAAKAKYSYLIKLAKEKKLSL